MTQVSREDVLNLARLSNLELGDEEVAELQADIAHILSYVNQLNELDTSGVEPTYQVSGRENVWRDDKIDQPLKRDELLALAPETHEHQIKVPKVL